MMGLLALVPGWAKIAAAAAVAFALGLAVGHFRGAAAAKEHERADRAMAITEALQQDAKAKEKGAVQALRDAAKVAAQTERLTDAVASMPDEVPSARRVRLGCEQLRADPRTDLSKLPDPCRPNPPAQAPAAP